MLVSCQSTPLLHSVIGHLLLRQIVTHLYVNIFCLNYCTKITELKFSTAIVFSQVL